MDTSVEACKVNSPQLCDSIDVTHLEIFSCEGLVAPVDPDGDLVAVVAGADLLV